MTRLASDGYGTLNTCYAKGNAGWHPRRSSKDQLPHIHVSWHLVSKHILQLSLGSLDMNSDTAMDTLLASLHPHSAEYLPWGPAGSREFDNHAFKDLIQRRR